MGSKSNHSELQDLVEEFHQEVKADGAVFREALRQMTDASIRQEMEIPASTPSDRVRRFGRGLGLWMVSNSSILSQLSSTHPQLFSPLHSSPAVVEVTYQVVEDKASLQLEEGVSDE